MDVSHVGFVLCALLLLYVIICYNGLVNLRNQMALAFSVIDVQLRKRHDLVPNLVEAVKGHAAHESAVLEAVSAARSHALRTGAGWAEQEGLQQAIGNVIARAEAYPALKASGHFLMLQRQLTECEAQIAAARRSYASSVMDYNNRVQMFPSSLVAGLFRFVKQAEFEIAMTERMVPDVRFP